MQCGRRDGTHTVPVPCPHPENADMIPHTADAFKPVEMERKCCQYGNVTNAQCQWPIENWQHWDWQHSHIGNILILPPSTEDEQRAHRDVGERERLGVRREDGVPAVGGQVDEYPFTLLLLVFPETSRGSRHQHLRTARERDLVLLGRGRVGDRAVAAAPRVDERAPDALRRQDAVEVDPEVVALVLAARLGEGGNVMPSAAMHRR